MLPPYRDVYAPNDCWLNDPTNTNPEAILRGFYPQFYLGNQLNLPLLTKNLEASETKAKELFKNLFSMPTKLIPEKQMLLRNWLQHYIALRFGTRITAHGVEEAKGGLYNLLLICIAQVVRVPAQYWGALTPGSADISPFSHGPYYLIYSTDPIQKGVPSNCPLKEVKYILVPYPENIATLTEKLNQMQKYNLINEEQKNDFIARLIDYANFEALLNPIKHYQPASPPPAGRVKIVPPRSPLNSKENSPKQAKTIARRDLLDAFNK